MNGLVLEGGGMRGAFTAGVLDVLLENNIHFDYVYGVSAGASNGASYIARQPERNRKIFVDGVKNFKYFSPKHIINQRNLLDVKLLFDTYPNSQIPFDYDTFESSKSLFYTCLTSCRTGKAVYIERNEVSRKDYMLKVLAGSNSLPLLSPAVDIDGEKYLDGGLSDSIPVKKAQEDGCDRTVVVLTREEGYRKNASSLTRLIKTVYRRYPEMTAGYANRHNEYNDTLDFCASEAEKGSVLIIRPESTMNVGRTEKNYTKLLNLYSHGKNVAEKELYRLKDFIN